MPACTDPVLVCEVGQYVGTASGGVPVTITHIDGTVIQPSSARVVCDGNPEHKKDLEYAWSNGIVVFQYPKPGPCSWGDGDDDHDANPPLDADPEPTYHVEATVDTNTTLCSGSFGIFDVGGQGYPRPPMSP